MFKWLFVLSCVVVKVIVSDDVYIWLISVICVWKKRLSIISDQSFGLCLAHL